MSRPYHNSLFSCCSPFGLCMKGWCCPCVVYGRNHYRAQHGTDQGYDTMNGACFGWAALGCLGGWGWVLQCLNRTDMQEKYNLEGSSCGACMTSCCCHCCELIQTHKELDYIQVSQNDQHHVGGYQQPGQMVAEPKKGYSPSPSPPQQPLAHAAPGAPQQPTHYGAP